MASFTRSRVFVGRGGPRPRRRQLEATVALAPGQTAPGPMTARSKPRGQKKEAASYFCPFAPAESFFVGKVSCRERRHCEVINRIVT